MMQNKNIIALFIGLFLFTMVSESFSQRRSTRERPSASDRDKDSDREDKEVLPFSEKLAYDILIGNVGFNGGLTVSAKAGVGYKIFDPLTAGLGAKISYQSQNNFGVNDNSYTGYALFPYLRYRIGEQFYLKGEYNFFSANLNTANNDPFKANFSFPMLGGGYAQGFGKWKMGIELLLMINDSVLDDTGLPTAPEKSDLYTQFEYNISFLYNL